MVFAFERLLAGQLHLAAWAAHQWRQMLMAIVDQPRAKIAFPR